MSAELSNDEDLAHLLPLTERRQKLLVNILWLGMTNKAAAKAAGMTEQAAYEAFRTPSFQHALKTEMKVRRAASRAGNLPALERIRNSSKNPMAVVAAAKVIEQIAGEGPQQASSERPGYVIAIPESLMARLGAAPQMTHQGAHADKPLIEHEPVGEHVDQRADDEE